jgi:hypothetical protein
MTSAQMDVLRWNNEPDLSQFSKEPAAQRLTRST